MSGIDAITNDCAARKSAAQQLIHGGDTAREGRRIWYSRKLTRTSKRHWSCWERWAGVIFASDCTLANSGRGRNRIAKLLKRLMIIWRIVPQASILACRFACQCPSA